VRAVPEDIPNWADWLDGTVLRDNLSRFRASAAPLAESVAAGLAAMADVFGFSPGSVLREVLGAIASKLVGRDLEVRVGDVSVSFVLREFRADPRPLGPPIGQLGDIAIDADDVRWEENHVDEIHVVARNVHIQPSSVNVLVAAPVDIEVVLGQPAVDEILRRRAPRTTIALGSATGMAALAGRPGLGSVEVTPSIDGGTVTLHATGLRLGRSPTLRTRLLERVPGLHLPLPLPAGMRIAEITIRDGRLVARGTLREWREPVTAAQLDDVVRRIRTLRQRTLELPRLPR